MSGDTPKKKFSLAKSYSWVALVGLVAGLVWLLLLIRGQRLPTLDRQNFEDAHTLWHKSQLTDYEITVAVTGRQPGKYVVRVRDGLAIESTMNGRSLTQPRTFGTWAVDGMFETLQRDLDTNDRVNNLMLGVEFDEQYGFPRRYDRLEMQTGIHDSLQWEVTKFESLSDGVEAGVLNSQADAP